MSDETDIESMLSKWEDLEDLTLTGLRALVRMIEREIAYRTKDEQRSKAPLRRRRKKKCKKKINKRAKKTKK